METDQYQYCCKPACVAELDNLMVLPSTDRQQYLPCFTVAYACDDLPVEQNSQAEAALTNPETHAKVVATRDPKTRSAYMCANY